MKIELRRVIYNAALSEETSAYTADIYIDGELAFRARNQGTGGADFYHQVGRWTEAEVNDWLKANRPRHTFGRTSVNHDLEFEVGHLLTLVIESRRLRRLMRTNLVTIERGQVFQYPLRKRPLETIVRAVRATNPDAIVVNGASEDVFEQALGLLCSQN